MSDSIVKALFRGSSRQPELSEDQVQDIAYQITNAASEARDRWPNVDVEADEFAAFIAPHFDEMSDIAVALGSLRLDELYLCCACMQGQAPALSALDEGYWGPARASLARMGFDNSQRDELIQQVRMRLFVDADDRPAKIRTFSGAGSLAGWLKVVVSREGLRVARRAENRKRSDEPSVLDMVSDGVENAEIEHIRARYKKEFEHALTEAFRRLRTDQRTLLRMYVTDGLTLAELGKLHQVNASTVSRWLARIRERLLKDARQHLSDNLNLRRSEFESLAKVMASALHLSVERLLATGPQDDD